MSDDSMNFAHYVATERAHLTEDRRAITETIAEWQARLADIDREFAAINAYESAKSGKPQRAVRATGQQRHYGARREAVVQAVSEAPDGVRRSELLMALGVKGDKRGEMSVSNALTALTKRGQLVREGGKYHVPSATALREAAE